MEKEAREGKLVATCKELFVDEIFINWIWSQQQVVHGAGNADLCGAILQALF